MNYNRKYHVAALLLLAGCMLGCVPRLYAQSASIHFRTLSWKGDVREIHCQSGKAPHVEIEAKDYVRSLPYKASSDDDLVFFRIVKNAAGEETRKELGRIPAAKMADDLLVLIVPKNAGYEFTPIREDADSFPPNSYRILNATQAPLAWKVGSETVKNIAPGTASTLKIDLSEKENGIAVQIAKIEINTQKGALVYSNRLAVRPGQRTLILAKESENENLPIETKRIVDVVGTP